MPYQIQSSAQKAHHDTADSENGKRLMSIVACSGTFVPDIRPPKIINLSCEIAGVPFFVRHIPRDDPKDSLIIWVTLGYLPFSLVSPLRRRALIRILEDLRAVRGVRFGIDSEMKIIAIKQFEISKPLSSTYFFEPLLIFVQRTRPYIRLIGEYLS